jgi:hypothetical protein
VLRRRLARAQEIGLAYPLYARIRATAGDDIIAILFSTNALRLLRATDALPPDRAARLGQLRDCGRAVLAVPPLDPAGVADRLGQGGLDCAAFPAPGAHAPHPVVRDRLAAPLLSFRWPAGRVILVGDAPPEPGWCAAARLAGYVPADSYFAQE